MKTLTSGRKDHCECLQTAPAPLRKRSVSREPEIASLASGLKLKRILVPTDFSAPSKKAFRYAAKFAEEFGASLTLLHVVEPIVALGDAYGWVETPAITDPALQKEASTRLAGLAQKEIGELIPVKPLVRCGKAYQEIVSVAKEREIDLIIIATHGYTGLKHVFLGSTAERVVRHAPCPVLIVREREHEFV